MVARGRVQNGVVVLDNGIILPEGQEVMVTVIVPVPVSQQKYHVSPERRAALLGLIGMLKTDQAAPSDEEAERIIEDARMEKYG